MKKLIVLFLSTMVIISSIFASSDYDQGYLDGYAACQNGEENAVQKRLEQKSHLDDMGVWILNHYVDSFGDETDEGYLSTIMTGTFSNSATTNSDLIAYFLIDEDEVDLKLLEYGDYEVKGDSTYSFDVKCDGCVYRYTAHNSGDRLSLDASCAQRFIQILQTEKPITLSIQENSRYSASSYLLRNIDTTGFNNALKQLVAE